MIHLFKSALARAFTYALMTVLAAALLLGALRLAVPYADALRDEVAALVAERTGLSVQLGAMEVRLRGWHPQLRFRDARLLDPASGHTQLAMDRLAIDLDLDASLRTLTPQIGTVALIGARLVIRRLADGRLLIGGMERAEGEANGNLAFFLRQGSFRLEGGELNWVDEGTATPPLVLSGVSAWLVNAGERHRFALRASGLAGTQVGLRLVADLTGDAQTPGRWDGRAYLGVSGADLAPLIRSPLPLGLRLASGGMRLDAWVRLRAGEPVEAQARLDLAGLELSRNPPGLPPEHLRLHALGGTLAWQRPDPGPGWRLDVQDLTLTQEGASWPATELGLAWSAQADGAWELRGGLRRARLGQVMALIQGAAPTLSRLLPLGGLDAFDRLLEAHPDGALRDLAWRLAGGAAGAAPTWALRGLLEGLTSAAAGPIPGLRGLDLDLSAGQDGGRLTLSGTQPTLDIPRLLPEPLRLARLVGDLTWTLDPDGRVRIDVPELVADHAAVATRTSLSLCLPPGGGDPFLDLRSHLAEGDLTKARGLVPVGILKQDLVSWLERALVAGRVPSGAVLFRGHLGDFPFREQEGRLEVLLDVRDGVLDYLPQWPSLTGLEGQVRFLNAGMEIVLERARILDSAVTGAEAQIDDLFNTKHLVVQATAEGPLSDGLRVLREGPLSRNLGPIANAFEVGGDMRLSLNLSAPLRRGLPLGLEGKITWPPGARVALKGTQAELRDPQGTLTFDPHSLSAEGIKARLWGAPVELDIATLGAAPGSGPAQGSDQRLTRVRLRSYMPVATLAERLPSSLWSQLQGTAAWDLKVDLHNADVGREALPIGFELESDLRRLAVRLPAPLGKPAGTARPLRLAGRFTPGIGATLDASAGDLAASLHLAPLRGGGLGLSGGRIDLGGDRPGQAQRPANGRVAANLREARVESVAGDKAGLWLSGTLAELDGDAWRDWWRREGPGLSGSPVEPPEGRTLLRGAELKIGRLTLGGATWDDLRLELARADDAWTADFKASQATGTLRLPDNPRDRPILGRLTRLDLKGFVDGDEKSKGKAEAAPGGPTADASSDPRQAPALDLEAEHLHWGQADLGQFRLLARPRPDGLDIAELSLDGPLAKATGSGAWLREADGEGPAVTRLKVEGESADLGELLRRLGLASAIEQAPGKASLSADWTGGPGDFALAGLNGRFELQVGAGGLLEVEPGVGRMLGILNFGALQRRLTLDFSDLFGKGYRFEGMSGDIALTRGEARIDRFELRGPAADIAVSGSADLKARRLDQLATVTPKISTGVAVASAVVGGPLVGAAVYLVDRVTGGGIDNIGRYQYRVEGAWDDPKVTPVGPATAATGASGAGVGPDLGGDAAPRPPSPTPAKPAPAAPVPRPGGADPGQGQNPFLQ